MSYLTNGLITVATVIAMEVVATVVHQFVMHGPGWGWHRSHHEPHDHVLEVNDLYAVVFAGLALALIIFAAADFGPIYWVGIGMTIYGFLYFVVHDGLVHQRWPFRLIPKNPYLKRLVQAHRLHHAVEGRHGCVSFGFLYAPPVGRLRDDLRARGSLGRPDSAQTGPAE